MKISHHHGKGCLFLCEVQLRKPPQQFGPPTSKEDVQSAAKGVIPLNTKCSNAWALGNLRSWMETGNSNSDEKVPEDLLSCPEAEVVCKWLCRFVHESTNILGKLDQLHYQHQAVTLNATFSWHLDLCCF